jgi:DNA ligase-1
MGRGVTFEPMLACPLDWDKIPTKGDGYYMEPKLDGVRCIADLRNPTAPVLYSRGGKPLTEKVPKIVGDLQRMFPGCIVDGELGYTNKKKTAIDFNLTMRVLGSGIDEANRKAHEINQITNQVMTYNVFDLLWSSDEDRTRLAALKRRLLLDDLFDGVHGVTWPLVHDTSFYPGFMESVYAGIVNEGGEGVILKNPDAPYYAGKRKANTWFKVKAFETVDAQITGFSMGQGKYTGMIGAIEYRTEDGTRGRCSGMDDSMRIKLSTSPGEYLGKWFEMRYFGRVGRDDTGHRFPQFLRFRTEKE